MDNHLHIVSFAIPYPPNYGGVIDVYYLIKSLHKQGVKVHLHCFQYNRGPSKYLNELCYSVHYYKRLSLKRHFFNNLPFIVVSRSSQELMKNLIKDNYPIIFEGIHCCFFLGDKKLKNRKKIVRAHNVEHQYYLQLAKEEKRIFKKYFFYSESFKLLGYEKILRYADIILSISKNDHSFLQKKHSDKVVYLPAFHPYNDVVIKQGRGDYVLYHGNLSVGENNKAALFLANQVFSGVDIPCVIAGMRPSNALKKAISRNNNIKLIEDPSEDEMIDLRANAHINILPTFQPTGIKLKLLVSLFSARFCLVNSTMVQNTGLEKLCIVADSADEMKKELKNIFLQSFSENEILQRGKFLQAEYSNSKNVQRLISLIFTEEKNLENSLTAEITV